MANALPEYTSFLPKDCPEDAAIWSDWLEGFHAMLTAMQIEADHAEVDADHPASTQWYDLFWHYIGKETRKKLKKIEDNGIAAKNYTKASEALTKYFAPTLNRVYQMHVLSETKQAASESMDAFYMRVKERIDLMSLNQLNVPQLTDLLIMSQLVNNTNNVSAKRKALKDGLSLKAFLDHARTCERTDQQLNDMSHANSESVNFVRGRQKTKKPGYKQQKNPNSSSHSNCKYCGQKHAKGKCPAYGEKCSKCGKMNHFARECLSVPKTTKGKPHKHVHQVIEEQESDYDSEESLYVVDYDDSEESLYMIQPKHKVPTGHRGYMQHPHASRLPQAVNHATTSSISQAPEAV